MHARDGRIAAETDFLSLLSDPDLLQMILFTCPDAIIATGPDGRIALFTGAAEPILGFDPFEVMGHHYSVLFPSPEALRQLDDALRRDGQVRNLEILAARKGAAPFMAALSAVVMRNRYDEGLGTVMFLRDHSDVRAVEETLRRNNVQLNHLVSRLNYLARHDQLTKLLNRSSAVEAAEDAFMSARLDDVRFGVALFDIDHFKRVNDGYGHLAGDVVLATVGAMLRRTVRQGDIVGRFGGEEFVAFLPGASLAETAALAERVRVAAEGVRVTVSETTSLTITLSAGVAAIPASGDTLEEALRIADDRLYRAKRAGRNQVVSDDADPAERSVA